MVSRLHRGLVRELWHLRGQVVATALVVACGIAVFVSMLSTYDSLISARSEYYSAYRLAQVFAQLKRAPDSLAARLHQIPGVAAVQTRVVEDVTLSVPGLVEPATARIISIPAAARPALNDLTVTRGRRPAPGVADEALVSQTFARANRLVPGSRIEAILNGRRRELRIVGFALSPEYVYEVNPAMIFPDNRRFGVIWMDRGILAAAFDMTGAFNDVSLSLVHGASLPEVTATVDRLLTRYGGKDAYARSEQASNRFLSDELSEIRINATYLPVVFLAVSAFLVYTLLSRLVAIQRGQIGLMKAFGYSNARVGLHFFEFAAAVVGLGAALGIGLGVYLAGKLVGLYQQYFHFPQLPLQVPLSVLLWAAAIAAAAAMAGAAAAVWRAVRMPPAEAMRPEIPKGFHAGLLEHSGVARWLGTTTRAVARNLLRRPLRAALSVTGIAAAVATVIVGRFTLDAVNYLIALHFNVAQRDDVTITLREERTGGVLQEIRRLPGVLRAEPIRSVPVRLRFQHREKRTAILGLDRTMDLRQLVDAAGRSVQLPPDGLLMTRKLAALLGIRLGDSVTVEELTGRRRVFTEPVVQLSDEPLGISAYMDARALAAQLGGQALISGALLQIDSSRSAQLYQELKRMPGVSTVAIRTAMLETIHEVMDRTFVVLTLVLSAFAVVLALGVVYNSARVALSERSRELASLRVLGFSTREVAALLLAEQAVLVIAAVPIGMILGVAICHLLVPLFDRELFRLPLILSPATFGFAATVVFGAAVVSGLLVAARIAALDMVAALKARE